MLTVSILFAVLVAAGLLFVGVAIGVVIGAVMGGRGQDSAYERGVEAGIDHARRVALAESEQG